MGVTLLLASKELLAEYHVCPGLTLTVMHQQEKIIALTWLLFSCTLIPLLESGKWM